VSVQEPGKGDVVDGRYLLRREIARGGMGAVYEAEQQVTGRIVALKLVNRGTRHAQVSEERLLREARAISQTRHRGIVEVLDAGICGRHGPYMALEMLAGRTLDGIIAAKRTLSVADVAHVGRQMCEALSFVHGRGIVHRDLKPSNVFVVRDGQRETVKLFDFGIAAVEDPRAGRKLTGQTEMIGTPEYMSPEQLFDEGPVDFRCDIYATGVTLFEALTGDVPFPGTYPQVLMQLAQADHPPSVKQFRADVGDALDEVICCALARDKDQRFGSAEELRVALVRATGYPTGFTTLLRGAGPSIPPAAPAPPRDDESDDASAPIPLVRRLHERVPYVTIVELDNGGVAVEARTEDISVGGILVRSEAALPLKGTVRVRFALPMSNEIIQVGATVRWSRESRAGGYAHGLQFADLPADSRRVILSYVQQP
jgi:eukaryotic-like serine/threonine-protein kinase